ncbi:MAG: fused MFS/spermidine synthase [Planctomycetaceae bacterium]|nr:fused MFS/spermidine synthase [Planctomycetaceae bacterium]
MKDARTTEGRAFGLLAAVTVVVSAFLLFQVQPVISKAILPWFGGSPAVWTVCLLFFQVTLLAGYTYAHLVISTFRADRAWWVHGPLLLVAIGLLPITPDDAWKPAADQSPVTGILLLLLANVGLPYFLLASTAPLVQVWYARVYPGRSPYRLYALSNAGSLGALLSYPFVVERTMTTQTQCVVWSMGFAAFAMVNGILSVVAGRTGGSGRHKTPRRVRPESAAPGSTRASWQDRIAWLLLPAMASLLLLAVTNHLCQQLLVVPFLWIAPLSLYLITFIICFDNERWYVPRWYGLLAAFSVLLVANMMLSASADALYGDLGVDLQLSSWRSSIFVEAGLILLMQFLVSMVCHGELVRRRPAVSALTAYYLSIAAGGALGGAFVALVCPVIFNSYAEFKLSLLAGFLLAVAIVYREGRRSWFVALPVLRWVTLTVGAVGLFLVGSVNSGTATGLLVDARRSFYGVLSIQEFPFEDPSRAGIALYHGSTMHGYQLTAPDRRRQPTLYYAPETGVGLALTHYPRRGSGPMRVGVIGLGAGTLAAYGQPGDVIRFYEIDPEVIDVAREKFTFLRDSLAEVEIVPGDARLVLEREPPQAFDLLVVDAFSDDAIPTHLLSAEAFQLYLRHLKPDGVLAFHVSNRHLQLGYVVQRLADHFNMPTRYMIHQPEGLRLENPPSFWLLATTNDIILNDVDILKKSYVLGDAWRAVPLWTDQYSSLHGLLW